MTNHKMLDERLSPRRLAVIDSGGTAGVPAWDSLVTYGRGALCSIIDDGGNISIFISLRQNNIGNFPAGSLGDWRDLHLLETVTGEMDSRKREARLNIGGQSLIVDAQKWSKSDCCSASDSCYELADDEPKAM